MSTDDFRIVDGVLKKYTGSETEVEIPDGVQSIGDFAFADRRRITSITIPDSVTSIGSCAFMRCYSLTSITFPASLKSIGDNAFADCNSLIKVEFNSQVDVNKAFAKTKYAVPKDEKTAIYLYVSGNKNKIGTAARAMIQENPNKYITKMLEMSQVESCDMYYSKIISLLSKFKSEIPDSTFQKVEETITAWDPENKELQCEKERMLSTLRKTIDSIQKQIEKSQQLEARKKDLKTIDDERLAKGERPDEKEVEEYVDNLFKKGLRRNIGNLPSTPVVYYRNSHIPVREDVLMALFGPYKTEFYRVTDILSGAINARQGEFQTPEFTAQKEADYIYQYIDPVSLDDLLVKLVYEKDYKDYVLSFARFASEENVKNVIKDINSKKTGKSKYWANNTERALVCSDTIAARKHYEKTRNLDRYAKFRDMTEQQLKDTLMIPDFGFDENGVKKFQCKGLDLSVTVNPNLTLNIFDCNTGKNLRTFPSKASGADPEQLKKVKSEFTAFKKDVKKFAEDKLLNIKQVHVERNQMKKETWTKVYVQNPVVKLISEGIVWTDKKSYFIPTEEGILDANGNVAYETGEKISVAHVLDMKPEEIERWKQFLIVHGIKQPFEQIWEPVVTASGQSGLSKFKEMTLSMTERNSLKKSLKQKGIDVYSDKVEGGYDRYTGTYWFADTNTMHFGKYVDVNYKINEDQSITFRTFKNHYLTGSKYAVNAIVFELSKIQLEAYIKTDRDNLISKQLLDFFTLSQILSFISLANQNKSTKCVAILLNYKNETYPEYNVLDELTLNL